MAIKIKDLVKKLEQKDQDDEVEFIVVTTKGMMVCMDIKTQAPNTLNLLKLFNSGEPEKVHPLNEGVDGTGSDDGCS